MADLKDFTELLHLLNSSESRESSIALIISCLNFCGRKRNERGLLGVDVYMAIINDIPTACFNHGIMNIEIVLQILKSVREFPQQRDITIAGFFLYALKAQDPSIPHGVVSIQHEERLVTLNYIGYYLHFANQGKFLWNSKRFMDLTETLSYRPDYISGRLTECDPNCVLTLFQYGARLYGEENSSYPTVQMFIPFMQSFFYRGRNKDQWDENLVLKIGINDLDRYTTNAMESFKIIMRVIPNPHVISYQLAEQEITEEFENRWFIPKIHKLLLLYDVLFLGLNFGRYEPASLKHLCRYYIRLRMNENWQLPYGIDGLRIPDTLKRYLNLLDD